jgi:uncharacterized protein YjlB
LHFCCCKAKQKTGGEEGEDVVSQEGENAIIPASTVKVDDDKYREFKKKERYKKDQ